MSEKPSPSTLRLLVGIMIGGSVASIGIAAWMVFKHEGTPLLLGVTGAVLAILAAVIGPQAKTKP